MLGLGGVGLIYGTLRYKRIARQLEGGVFIIGSRGIELPIASGIILTLVAVAMGILFS